MYLLYPAVLLTQATDLPVIMLNLASAAAGKSRPELRNTHGILERLNTDKNTRRS